MTVNPAIAHRLLLLLAELGHAESQADVGFHLALGVEPVAPNSKDQLFKWVAASRAEGLAGGGCWGPLRGIVVPPAGTRPAAREPPARSQQRSWRRRATHPPTHPCRLVPPDVPAALVHYSLAASAGDPVAQMSLGYRHLQGLGVPQSCQTGGRAGGWARGACRRALVPPGLG